MVSKKQDKATLVEDLEQEVEELKAVAEEATQRADRLARDNDAYRSSEAVRRRVEHAEKQRKMKQAERKERLKRVEQMTAGQLPLDGAESVSITHEGGEVFVDVTVKLTQPEHQAVQDYLNNQRKVNVNVRVFDEVKAQDAINRTLESVKRITEGGIYQSSGFHLI